MDPRILSIRLTEILDDLFSIDDIDSLVQNNNQYGKNSDGGYDVGPFHF